MGVDAWAKDKSGWAELAYLDFVPGEESGAQASARKLAILDAELPTEMSHLDFIETPGNRLVNY
jgi:hypothetical protein